MIRFFSSLVKVRKTLMKLGEGACGVPTAHGSQSSVQRRGGELGVLIRGEIGESNGTRMKEVKWSRHRRC